MVKTDLLACPNDLSALHASEVDLLTCSKCGARWPIENGVVRFLELNDPFYEGAYKNQVRFVPRTEGLRHAWPLWLVNGGYLWAVRRHVPRGAAVLELGCAGGVRYFGQRYRMVGCDLSRASLRCAAGVYDLLVQADAATRLPFADGSLDAVISSFFWEHIPPGTKPTILAECRRVLRPGGRLVFLYDVETDNPTTRRLKERNGALYRELFLEGDGHVGYESRDENLSTFKAAGFRVLEDAGVEGTPVQSPSVYEKMARERTPASRLLRAGASLGNAPWHHLYVAMLRVLDVSVGRVMPRSWARVVLTVAVMEQPLHG